MNFILLSIFIGFLLSLPHWLPALIIRLRILIFTRINGDKTIHLPSKEFNSEDFMALYANPSMAGRSKGAALSDLFWYWLSPGPEIHPEHLELSDRYEKLSLLTRKILAMPKKEIEALIDQRQCDPLKLNLNQRKPWKNIRLRDQFIPLWADIFYQIVFKEPCSKKASTLIVNHASDVVNALKCCKLRNMAQREKLTDFLLEKIEHEQCPYEFPADLSHREKALFLQAAFFNTGVVQMSEAMAHLVLSISQHPECQHALKNNPSHRMLDDVINESLRLHPLFGIAHRIVNEPIEIHGKTIEKDTVVCFNYPDYHKTGYENPDSFKPERWQSCPIKQANFIPFGVLHNRPCPAQGMAMVAMRQLTHHLIKNYYFTSPIKHTRSLPNRGPCLVMLDPKLAQSRYIHYVVFPFMKLADRWEDLYRSFVQLFLGTAMVLHAKKLKLCEKYFEKIQKDGESFQYPNSSGSEVHQ